MDNEKSNRSLGKKTSGNFVQNMASEDYIAIFQGFVCNKFLN